MTEKKTASVDYKQAGVDIAAGEQAVKNIKGRVRSTYNGECAQRIG